MRSSPIPAQSEAQTGRQLEIASGERDEILREAGVTSAIDVEDILDLPHQADRTITGKRVEPDRSVDQREIVGWRFEWRDVSLLTEILHFEASVEYTEFAFQCTQQAKRRDTGNVGSVVQLRFNVTGSEVSCQ